MNVQLSISLIFGARAQLESLVVDDKNDQNITHTKNNNKKSLNVDFDEKKDKTYRLP